MKQQKNNTHSAYQHVRHHRLVSRKGKTLTNNLPHRSETLLNSHYLTSFISLLLIKNKL